jgi:hypothetical protein
MKLCWIRYIFTVIKNAAGVCLGNRTGETDSTAMLPSVWDDPGRYRMGVIGKVLTQ